MEGEQGELHLGKALQIGSKERKPRIFRCKENKNHPGGLPAHILCCGKAQQRGQINRLFLANCLVISSWSVATNIPSPKQTAVERGRGHGAGGAHGDLSRQEFTFHFPIHSQGSARPGGQGWEQPGLGKVSCPWQGWEWMSFNPKPFWDSVTL